jgi:hypothetical protein
MEAPKGVAGIALRERMPSDAAFYHSVLGPSIELVPPAKAG